MRPTALVCAAILAAALAGCGGVDADPAQPTDGPTPTTGGPGSPGTPGAGSPTVPPPADGSLPPDLEEDPRVRAALEDAKGRVGVVPAEVVVAGYTPVTWNDGSLGCPTKGQMYTQATVEGELLLLRADQRLMSYHAANGGDFAYCAAPGDNYTVRAG